MVLDIYLLGIFCLAGELPALNPSAGAFYYLEKISIQIDAANDPSSEYPGLNKTDLLVSLDLLEKSIEVSQKNLIRTMQSNTLDLEPKNDPVFGGRVVLPAEIKHNGIWRFLWQKIDVIPDNLWMYGLTFKGKTTLRLRSIIVFFEDGSRKVFDQWAGLEDGNGKAFEKEQWIPFLWFSTQEEAARPRKLKGIHILGSAQDGSNTAKLDFLFRVPDPKPEQKNPYQRNLHRMKTLIEQDQLQSFVKVFHEFKASFPPIDPEWNTFTHQ